MAKHPRCKTSKLAKALAPYFDTLPVDELSQDSCPSKNRQCPIAFGIEHLFVTHTVSCAHKRIIEVHGDNSLELCHIAYSPHSTKEGGGFDLSLGSINDERRVLVMHKLQARKWCDSPWTWDSRKERNAHKQIERLLRLRERNPLIVPYLAIHTCCCLHEFRRMGKTVEGVDIPSFYDAKRSTFVDLSQIGNLPPWKTPLAKKELWVTVKLEKNTPQVVVVKDNKPIISLDAVDLSKFLDRVAGHLSG